MLSNIWGKKEVTAKRLKDSTCAALISEMISLLLINTINKIWRTSDNIIIQECIPVGCVPPAQRPLGVSGPGGLCLGGLCLGNVFPGGLPGGCLAQRGSDPEGGLCLGGSAQG